MAMAVLAASLGLHLTRNTPLFRPSRNFSFSTDATELEVGDTFTLQLDAANVTDLTGWQADLAFNPAVLKVTQVLEGDFLKQNDGETFFQEGTIQNGTGKITGLKSVQLSRGKGFPNGTLLSVDFTVIGKGKSLVTLENFQAGTRYGKILHVTPPELSIVVGSQDVNGDGSVNILDLTLIAARFGQRGAGNPADVNGRWPCQRRRFGFGGGRARGCSWWRTCYGGAGISHADSSHGAAVARAGAGDATERHRCEISARDCLSPTPLGGINAEADGTFAELSESV